MNRELLIFSGEYIACVKLSVFAGQRRKGWQLDGGADSQKIRPQTLRGTTGSSSAAPNFLCPSDMIANGAGTYPMRS